METPVCCQVLMYQRVMQAYRTMELFAQISVRGGRSRRALPLALVLLIHNRVVVVEQQIWE